MKKSEDNNEWLHMLYVLIGVALFSASYRFFLIPAGLYCGGFTGVAQIIKWVIADACGIPVPTISLLLLLSHTSRCGTCKSLLGSSATTPLVDFHHRLTACPSYDKQELTLSAPVFSAINTENCHRATL